MHTKNTCFEELLFDHVEMLYEVAVGLTHDPAEAERLTENTVAQALHAHERAQLRIQLKPWLLNTLRNTFLAHRDTMASSECCAPAPRLRPAAAFHNG